MNDTSTPLEQWHKAVDRYTQGKNYPIEFVQDVKNKPELIDRLVWWKYITSKIGGWPFIIGATVLTGIGGYLLYRLITKALGKYRKNISEEELEEELQELKNELANQAPTRILIKRSGIKENIKKFFIPEGTYVTLKPGERLVSLNPSNKGPVVDKNLMAVIQSSSFPPLGAVLSLLINPPDEEKGFVFEPGVLEALKKTKDKIFPNKSTGLAGKLSDLSSGQLLLLGGGTLLGLVALLAYLKTLFVTRKAREAVEDIEELQGPDLIKVPAYRIIKESHAIKNLNDKIKEEMWEDIEFIHMNLEEKDLLLLEKIAKGLIKKGTKHIDYEEAKTFEKQAFSFLKALFSLKTWQYMGAAILAAAALLAGYYGFRFARQTKWKEPSEIEQLSDLADEPMKYMPYSLSSSIEPVVIIQKKRRKKTTTDEEEE